VDDLDPQTRKINALTFARKAAQPIDHEAAQGFVGARRRLGNRENFGDVIKRLLCGHQIAAIGLRL
jgi:hypothetical protein